MEYNFNYDDLSKFNQYQQGIGSNVQNYQPMQSFNSTGLNQNSGLGSNSGFTTMDKLGALTSGIQALSGLYSAWKQIGMAQDQLALQKDQWNKSYEMSKKSFNEGIAQRSRLLNNGQSAGTKAYNEKYQVK